MPEPKNGDPAPIKSINPTGRLRLLNYRKIQDEKLRENILRKEGLISNDS